MSDALACVSALHAKQVDSRAVGCTVRRYTDRDGSILAYLQWPVNIFLQLLNKFPTASVLK